MAEISPFRAWRYNKELTKNIGELTSPLFDVATERQKSALYGNPYNSIHLSIPFGDRPAENAGRLLKIWKKWTFGLIFQENAFQVRLKPDVYHTLKWKFPPEIKMLDLTVLHFFIVQEILGIKGEDQNTSNCIEYERSFSACLTKVVKGDAQLALITNDISIEDVKAVCGSGCTLPQKSTHFWPKVICGFVFSSL